MNLPKNLPGQNKNSSTSTKTVEHSGKIKQQKIAKTGVDSRIKGHLSARGKRSQAKRDSR